MNYSQYNKIVIVGLPATGKSTLSEELATRLPEHKLYHTDDYIASGFTQSLFDLMGDMYGKEKIIVEGVQCYRLLKAGLIACTFHADLVIHCAASTGDRVKRYKERNKELSHDFDNKLRGWWYQYNVAIKPHVEIIEHYT